MAGYQIKVTIEGTKPPVWRRMEIPDQITLSSLHEMLQEAFGWEDEHLHEFSFQYAKAHVFNERNMDGIFEEFAEPTETKLLADDFLKAGWIRYTYDFGVALRHRIVLEKELPDYKKRYARVIKFKGNNLAEDSGSAWGEEDDEKSGVESGEGNGEENEPGGGYDMEQVNARLKKMIRKPDSEAMNAEQAGIWVDEKKVIKQKRREAMDTLREMGKVFLEMMDAKNNPAPVDRCLKEIYGFYGKFPAGNLFEKSSTERMVEELLQQDGLLHLSDLQKYFGISGTIIPSIGNLARETANELKQHPEYMTLLFPAEELQLMIRAVQSEGACAGISQAPEHLWEGLVLLGLAEIQIVEKNKKKILQYAFPKEMEEIVCQLKRMDLKRAERQTEKLWLRLRGLIGCYGVTSLDNLHEQYEILFGEINREEMERCLYLRGTMRKAVVTYAKERDDAEDDAKTDGETGLKNSSENGAENGSESGEETGLEKQNGRVQQWAAVDRDRVEAYTEGMEKYPDLRRLPYARFTRK